MVERYSSVMSGSCAADFISVSQMACRFGILFMALRLLSFVKVVHDDLVFLAIAHHGINAVTFAAAFACKRHTDAQCFVISPRVPYRVGNREYLWRV